MTVQLFANALLIVALLCWIGYRQVTWQPVSITRMCGCRSRSCLIGLFTLTRGSIVIHLTTLDLAIFLIEIVISLGVGAAMGAMATFRPLGHEAAEAKASRSARRGGGLIPPWKLAPDGFVSFSGSVSSQCASASPFTRRRWARTWSASAGMIFIMFAANRAARALVFAYRVDRLAPVAAA